MMEASEIYDGASAQPYPPDQVLHNLSLRAASALLHTHEPTQAENSP
jgi:hypothetical protein